MNDATPRGQETAQQPAAAPKVAATHDFTGKLRQPAMMQQLQGYIRWQQARRAALRNGQPVPELEDWAPLSINLDLTTACNYRCDHCIDWDVLNSPIKYDFERLKDSLRNMAQRGMRSVILIGGGEPTLHPGFVETVRFLKDLKVQVAIVSNGSKNDKILEIIDCMTEGDWVRLSLDSGSNETFRLMHKPVKELTLDEICSWVPKIRARNPKPLVGFSFIIAWRGAQRDERVPIHENIDEIVSATRRAREYGFSYISLTPLLTRRADGAEVMDPTAAEALDRTLARIRVAVDEAKKLATPTFQVIESTNLRVLEAGTWHELTRQPRMCHMQALRQVLSPMGLYNCPAHRGVDKAMIAGRDAYASDRNCAATAQATGTILERFDASHECKEVTCLYHAVNWWVEERIQSGRALEAHEVLPERNDWFL